MKTLDPWAARGLAVLDTANPKGLKMAHELPRRNGYPITRPTRWTKDANGRTLPLNSAAWGKLRRMVLAEVPLCEYCPPGVVTPAVAVDHRNNNPADNTRANLASTCVSCHSVKTAADMHGTVARLGCDESGYPRAGGHHWNKAAVRPSSGLAEPSTEAPEIDRSESANTDLYQLR